MKIPVFCFLLNAFFLAAVAVDEQEEKKGPSDAECEQLGFKRSELHCSRCDELKKFDLELVRESCLNCCQPTDEITSGVKTHAYARLEICNCNLANFPQIQAFVKSDRAKAYPRLSVRHVRGTLPVLKLLDENKQVVDELSVQKWDTSTLEEFFSEHLAKPDSVV